MTENDGRPSGRPFSLKPNRIVIMKIAVASGKGGTGKTTVSTAIALTMPQAVFLDADVEEPDAHIFLKPEIKKTHSVPIMIPRIDYSKCDFCGECAKACAYNAIAVVPGKVLVFDEVCKGCGTCTIACPQRAIYEVPREIGVINEGFAADGRIHFYEGKLNIGESATTHLIRQLKKFAETDGDVVIDAPPGTSCPMLEATKFVDFVILVAEPTPFGIYDLNLSIQALRDTDLKLGIVVNKYGIGNDDVFALAEKYDIPILMKIPFDRELASAYSKGIPLTEARPEMKAEIEAMLDRIRELAGGGA